MTNASTRRLVPAGTPTPLLVGAAVATLEGLVLVGYAVLELLSLDSGRIAVALTTGAFFAIVGVTVIGCAWALVQGRSWARSPVVLAQLVALGLAWSFRGGETGLVAGSLVVVAAIGLIGIFHPRSIEALTHDD